MKITKTFLTKKSACQEGIDWVSEHKLIGLEPIPFINALIKEDKLDWANWLIVRCMKYKQYVSYAVFAAEQVIDIYEKKYLNDKRPREAIEAAKKCIKNPSKENKDAASASAYAVFAASAASASAASASAAVSAYAASAAAASASAASASAYAVFAASASDAAYKLRLKILNNGIKLLKK